MCGIIAAFHTGKESPDANDWALKTFENQYKRGIEGFGIVGWTPDEPKIEIHRACEPAKFMFDIHAYRFPMLMVHHRTPTSTENKLDQTHPIRVSNGSLKHDYLVIHNGILYNHKAIHDKHVNELGFIYSTEYKDKKLSFEKYNDSEVLAIELAMVIEGQKKALEVDGSAAFIALQIDKATDKVLKVYFGRNDKNPLNMGKSRNGANHKIHLSSMGEGDEVQADILYSFEPIGEMPLFKSALVFAPPRYQYIEPPKHQHTGASSSTPPYKPSQTVPTNGTYPEGYSSRHQTSTSPPQQATFTEGSREKAANQEFLKKLTEAPQGKLDKMFPGPKTENEWEAYYAAEEAAMGDFDFDHPPEDGTEEITDAIENYVLDYLDMLRDPDTIVAANVDDTMRMIRDVLAEAKNLALIEMTEQEASIR